MTHDTGGTLVLDVERDSDGRAIHGEVRAGDGVIWLHRAAPEHGLASPRTVGASTGMTAVMVDDVDAHHEHVQSLTGQSIGPPVDQPYGVREYTVAGPEGELWSFMTPRGRSSPGPESHRLPVAGRHGMIS